MQQLNLIPSTLQGPVFGHPNNTERNFKYKFMSLHGFYYIYRLRPSISLSSDKQQVSIFHTKFFQNLYPKLFMWRWIRRPCFSQIKEIFFPNHKWSERADISRNRYIGWDKCHFISTFYIHYFSKGINLRKLFYNHTHLTLILLMWRIGWAHNNARK